MLFLVMKDTLVKGILPFAIPAMFCLLIVIIPLLCILVLESINYAYKIVQPEDTNEPYAISGLIPRQY